MWRRLLVLTLVTSMTVGPQVRADICGQSFPHMGTFRRKLKRAPIGSHVVLKLTSGQELEGSLEAIDAEAVTLGLLEGPGSQRRVPHERVAKVKVLNRMSYRAAGRPNGKMARRAVHNLGVGRHVMAEEATGIVSRGHIQEISESYFALKLDGSSELRLVSYDHVLQVRENHAVWALLGIGIVLLIYWLKGGFGQSGIISLSPDSAPEGGPGFTLTVRGHGFKSASVVRWDGKDRPTTFISDKELQAVIFDRDVWSAMEVEVTVATNGEVTYEAVFLVFRHED